MTSQAIPENISPEFQRLIDQGDDIKEESLAQAIPKKLYQPRLGRGMVSLGCNLAVYLGALVAIAIAPHWIFYPFLFLVAGLGGWGLFCIAHDCGHNSFSKSRHLNYSIGHIVLIPLLYPFHGWRHMHNMHHANTNSLEKDTDWRPVFRSQYERMSWREKLVYNSTRSWLFWLGTVNYQRHSGFRFNMFAKRDARNDVRRSILFVTVVAAILFPSLLYFTGIKGLLLYFVGPWLGIHAWFSLTTMMQHVGDETPFVSKDYWSMNASRLLLTTDYMYPKWLLFLTNYISVHTAHHVAPIIPHYNLPQAQQALNNAFPGLLRIKPFKWQDVWHVICHCHLFDPTTGYYQSFNDKENNPQINWKASTVNGLSVLSIERAGRMAADIFGNTR